MKFQFEQSNDETMRWKQQWFKMTKLYIPAQNV